MKLQYVSRSNEKKSESKVLRRNGKIPSVLYSRGKDSVPITVDDADFQAILRQIKSGRLPTTIFELEGEDKSSKKCIIKDIQYHPTTYNVLHLDFEELLDDVPVNLNVPIECTGVVDCVGIKLGGVLRQVIRYLKVSCLPKDIPSRFEVDIAKLGQRQSKRLRDIAIPAEVKPLADLNEVAVAIVKR